MMTKKENQQIEMHLITIEDLVPMDHLLRKVNDIIDFSFIYNEVENMYCHNNGRPSIDPVALIKFLLIGFLYGIHWKGIISSIFQSFNCSKLRLSGSRSHQILVRLNNLCH